MQGGGQDIDGGPGPVPVAGPPMVVEHAPCRSVVFCRSHADSVGLTLWSAVAVAEEWTRATSRAAVAVAIRSAGRAAEARCILRGGARLELQQLQDPVALLLAAGEPLRTPYLPPRFAAVEQVTLVPSPEPSAWRRVAVPVPLAALALGRAPATRYCCRRCCRYEIHCEQCGRALPQDANGRGVRDYGC